MIQAARRYYLDMRIVVTGDRTWACDDLAVAVVQRLIAQYGQDIVVVHAGSVGVDEFSISRARTWISPLKFGLRTRVKPDPNARYEESRADQARCGSLYRSASVCPHEPANQGLRTAGDPSWHSNLLDRG